MSGPQPPYASETIRNIVQHGGPIGVATGAGSAAITFGYAFQDTNYQLDIEWVSGPPPTQSCLTPVKNPAYSVITNYGTIASAAFNWQAWRLV